MNAQASPIPRFFLYGIEERATDRRFLHVEAIEDRLEMHNWDVRPHLHHRLNQLMLLRQGSGEFLIEDTWHRFVAPVLIVAPADVVHGFRLSPDTNGPVVTIAEEFFGEISAAVEPELAGTLDRPLLLEIPKSDYPAIDAVFANITNEYRWASLGQATALLAQVAMLFALVARQISGRDQTGVEKGHAGQLFIRFRMLVEDHYTEHWSIADYARELAVTPARLNATCRRIVNRSALEIVHARLLTEARRLLHYSMMTASETAYTLGFKDPAYFSRFFIRRMGEPPGAFRDRARH